jgi:hypothetical protein
MDGKADAKVGSGIRSRCFLLFAHRAPCKTPAEIDGCDRKLPFCKVRGGAGWPARTVRGFPSPNGFRIDFFSTDPYHFGLPIA